MRESALPDRHRASPSQAGIEARDSDKALMLVSTLARMMVGALTFVVLARYLGPVAFGVIATAVAYAAFASLVTDFGFAVSGLRRAAAEPEKAEQIVWHLLQVKAALSFGVMALGAASAWLVLPHAYLPIYLLAYLGALAQSAADLIMICARARRDFRVEARLVVTGSTVMLFGVGGAALLTGDITLCAMAFAASRVIHLAIAARVLLPLSSFVPVPDLRHALGSSTGHALDNILTAWSSQADLLVFGALLTPHAAGVYQAGARLVQAIVPFAVVLSTVYLPALTAAVAMNDEGGFRRSVRQLNLEFAALSIIGSLGFLIAGPVFTRIVYGPAYASLIPLWSGFAVFVALRFGASGFGIQLAVRDHLRLRILANLVSTGTLVLCAALILPRAGLAASSTVLALSAVPSFVLLGAGSWHASHRARRAA